MMTTIITEPASYEAWYHTPRGQWIGDLEFVLIQKLLRAKAGSTLLDVGCGTGYFSRRFREKDLQVTAIDSSLLMLEYAYQQSSDINFMQARAEGLPFADNSFDYVTAITSLCFVESPEGVLQEMWRVAKKGILLGLLNRHSLLYRQKQGKGMYSGARWDSCTDARHWVKGLMPKPGKNLCQSAIFLPNGGYFARAFERRLPFSLPWGGFLAVCLLK